MMLGQAIEVVASAVPEGGGRGRGGRGRGRGGRGRGRGGRGRGRGRGSSDESLNEVIQDLLAQTSSHASELDVAQSSSSFWA